MEILRLILKNFISYKSLDLNLKNKGLTLIHGKTGTGKSTIFKGIFYALIDRVDGFNVAELQNWHNEDLKTEVKLLIKVNGIQYWIIKEISKGKAKTLVKSKNDKELSKNTENWLSTDYKNFIKELIGIDYDTILNSSYVKQGEASELVLGSFSKRNDIFSKFEEIPVIEKARNILSEKNKKIKKEYERKQYKIYFIEGELGAVDSDKLLLDNETIENKVNIIKEEITNKISYEINLISKKINTLKENSINARSLTLDIARIEKSIKISERELSNSLNTKEMNERLIPSLKKSIIEKNSEARNILKEIEELESKENNIDFFTKNLGEIESDLEKNEKKYIDIISERKNIIFRINEIEEETDSVNSISFCDKCKQNVSIQHKVEHDIEQKKKLAILKNKLEVLKKEETMRENKINSLKYDMEKIKETINSLDNKIDISNLKHKYQIIIHKSSSDKEKFRRNFEIIKECRKTIASLSEKIKNQKSILLNKKTQLSEIQKDPEIISNLESRLNILYSEKERKENELLLLISEKESISNKLKSYTLKCEELENLNESIQKIESEVKENSILETAFAKNGLRLFKINRMIELLNSYISIFSSHFSDSKICSIEFFINSKNKIDIRVWMQGATKFVSISNLSGGEKDMIVVPVILSLAIYVSSKNFLNTIFIDEFLTSLDSEKKSLVYDILNEIKQNGINVFLISHDEIIKKYEYDNYIYVRQDENFSKVEERSKNERLS